MRKINAIVLLLGLLVLVPSCSNDPINDLFNEESTLKVDPGITEDVDEETAGSETEELPEIADAVPLSLTDSEKAMVRRQNDFAFKMLAAEINGEDANPIFSPMTFNNVLGMTALAAYDNNSISRIANALGIKDSDFAAFHSTNKKIREYICNADPTSQVLSENATFSEATLRMNDNGYYNASVLDGLSDIQGSFNQWINKVTLGLIQDFQLPGKQGENMMTILANTMYFSASWRAKMSKKDTHRDYFNNADGSTSVVTMLTHRNYEVYGGSNYLLMSVPYGNNAFEMLVILPDKGVSLNKVLGNLSAKELNIVIQKDHKYDVVKDNLVPLFNVKSTLDFKGKLKTLGLDDIYFDTYMLGKSCKTPMSILMSKTVFNVSENGVQGASVGMSGGLCGSYIDPDKEINECEFICDRPFIYIVREQSTGAFMLMGMITDMKDLVKR